jgi:transposase-like protein
VRIVALADETRVELALLFLALRNAEKKWRMPEKTWKSAMNQFQIHFEGRLPA